MQPVGDRPQPRSGTSGRLSQWARAAVQSRVVVGALKVSLVVGTVLNLINQGDHLMAGEGIQWGRLLLNYVVPYCVSTYSAARMAVLQRASGDT
jgi:hypothetical protein